VNPNSALFPYIPAIFLSLHLLYEEIKLDSTLHADLHQVANLLSRLAGNNMFSLNDEFSVIARLQTSMT
jgi:hypothetical protein